MGLENRTSQRLLNDLFCRGICLLGLQQILPSGLVGFVCHRPPFCDIRLLMLSAVVVDRIFVDALDSQYYKEHNDLGSCPFVRFQREGQQCYCRLLEGLVNVWAYHSARRMIYVDPRTGQMVEQHVLESRRNKMWVNFFSLNTLRALDEDLAEAADDEDHPRERWLWPKTGEVYCQSIAERERQERLRLKQAKRQKLKEKLSRMRIKNRQKSLGKYIKPPPGIGFLPPLGPSR